MFIKKKNICSLILLFILCTSAHKATAMATLQYYKKKFFPSPEEETEQLVAQVLPYIKPLQETSTTKELKNFYRDLLERRYEHPRVLPFAFNHPPQNKGLLKDIYDQSKKIDNAYITYPKSVEDIELINQLLHDASLIAEEIYNKHMEFSELKSLMQDAYKLALEKEQKDKIDKIKYSKLKIQIQSLIKAIEELEALYLSGNITQNELKFKKSLFEEGLIKIKIKHDMLPSKRTTKVSGLSEEATEQKIRELEKEVAEKGQVVLSTRDSIESLEEKLVELQALAQQRLTPWLKEAERGKITQAAALQIQSQKEQEIESKIDIYRTQQQSNIRELQSTQKLLDKEIYSHKKKQLLQEIQLVIQAIREQQRTASFQNIADLEFFDFIRSNAKKLHNQIKKEVISLEHADATIKIINMSIELFEAKKAIDKMSNSIIENIPQNISRKMQRHFRQKALLAQEVANSIDPMALFSTQQSLKEQVAYGNALLDKASGFLDEVELLEKEMVNPSKLQHYFMSIAPQFVTATVELLTILPHNVHTAKHTIIDKAEQTQKELADTIKNLKEAAEKGGFELKEKVEGAIEATKGTAHSTIITTKYILLAIIGVIALNYIKTAYSPNIFTQLQNTVNPFAMPSNQDYSPRKENTHKRSSAQ